MTTNRKQSAQLGTGGIYCLTLSGLAWVYADPSGFGLFHFASIACAIFAKLFFFQAILATGKVD